MPSFNLSPAGNLICPAADAGRGGGQLAAAPHTGPTREPGGGGGASPWANCVGRATQFIDCQFISNLLPSSARARCAASSSVPSSRSLHAARGPRPAARGDRRGGGAAGPNRAAGRGAKVCCYPTESTRNRGKEAAVRCPARPSTAHGNTAVRRRPLLLAALISPRAAVSPASRPLNFTCQYLRGS